MIQILTGDHQANQHSHRYHATNANTSPFNCGCKEMFMLHRSPVQHSTNSSGVGWLPQRRVPPSLPTMQPFSRTAVRFSMEREVKHLWPKHLSPLVQDDPSHKHSESLTLPASAKEKYGNQLEFVLMKKSAVIEGQSHEAKMIRDSRLHRFRRVGRGRNCMTD